MEGTNNPLLLMTNLRLIPSDNSKVKFRPNHKNTFGLNFGLVENGGTCPGATLGKGGCLDTRDGKKRPTCYMAKITQIYKAVGKILQSNTDMLKGKTVEEMADIFKNTFQEFVSHNKPEHWYYRLTYSGDVYCQEMAEALVIACNSYPDVQFWMYTRSHSLAHVLVRANNLAVYLSIDPVNHDTGVAVYNELSPKYNNLGLAYLGPPTADGMKYVKCPETHGNIANTPKMGACAKCKLCFTYNDRIKLRHISFKQH